MAERRRQFSTEFKFQRLPQALSSQTPSDISRPNAMVESTETWTIFTLVNGDHLIVQDKPESVFWGEKYQVERTFCTI